MMPEQYAPATATTAPATATTAPVTATMHVLVIAITVTRT
jgi:hypothetical protein